VAGINVKYFGGIHEEAADIILLKPGKQC